ncbi:MAG: hypothetical protein ACLFP1_02655 [Candidatus Goldiibacteriota bacterium]
MIIFLTVINIILIAAVIVLFFRIGKSGGHAFSDLEDVELLEFQENLKKLIDRMKETAEKGTADMRRGSIELEARIKEAEKNAKELKYLIERSRHIKSVERKKEKAPADPAEKEETDSFDLRRRSAGDRPGVKSAEPEKEPKKTAKFEMDEEERNGDAGGQDKFTRVSRLLDRGLGVDEIVSVTGYTRSEVALIKNLKKG